MQVNSHEIYRIAQELTIDRVLVSTARENDPSAANESSTARTGDGCVGLYIGFLISCAGVPGGAA